MECEVRGDSPSTGAGLRWGGSYSRSLPLEVWSAGNSTRQSDGAGESGTTASHDGGQGGGIRKRDGGWLCICNSMQPKSIIILTYQWLHRVDLSQYLVMYVIWPPF